MLPDETVGKPASINQPLVIDFTEALGSCICSLWAQDATAKLCLVLGQISLVLHCTPSSSWGLNLSQDGQPAPHGPRSTAGGQPSSLGEVKSSPPISLSSIRSPDSEYELVIVNPFQRWMFEWMDQA